MRADISSATISSISFGNLQMLQSPLPGQKRTSWITSPPRRSFMSMCLCYILMYLSYNTCLLLLMHAMSETLSFLNTPDSPFVGDINKWNIWTRLLVKVGEDQKHGVATAGNQPASRSNGPKRTGGSTCMTEGTVRNITYLKVTFACWGGPQNHTGQFRHTTLRKRTAHRYRVQIL